MKHYARKINILTGVITNHGGSKTKLLRQSAVDHGREKSFLIDQLVESGLLKEKKLKGDRVYISITDRGRLLVKMWQDFTDKF